MISKFPDPVLLQTISAQMQNFWHMHAKNADNPSVILVDLFHVEMEYILHSCLIAQYLRVLTGAKLVGLCGQPHVFKEAQVSVPIENIRALTKLFQFEAIEEWTDDVNLPSSLAAANGTVPFPQHMLRQSANNTAHLWRAAYESDLRANLRPTVPALDRPFALSVANAQAFAQWFGAVLNKHKASSIVMGHIDYNPWRIMGEMALLNGLEVYNFLQLTQVSLWKYKTNTLPVWSMGELRRKANMRAMQDVSHKLQALPLEDFLKQSSKGFIHRGAPFSPVHIFDAKLRSILKPLIRAKFELPLEQAVVCVYAHTWSDIPLSDEQATIDLAHWIRLTLETAAKCQDRIWLIKPHPKDAIYDKTGFYNQLKQEFASFKHIRFLDHNELTQAESLIVADLFVSVRGSIGFEAPSHGVPCLLAGKAPYDGAGFAHIGCTHDDYVKFLVQSPQHFRVSQSAQNQAQATWFFENAVGQMQSTLLPQIGSHNHNPQAYFQKLLWNISHYFALHKDPLYISLQKLIRSQQPSTRAIHPLFYEFEDLKPEKKLSDIPSCLSIPCVQGSYFSLFEQQGFDIPEQQGTWVVAPKATLSLPIPADTAINGLKLCSKPLLSTQALTLRCNGKTAGQISYEGRNLAWHSLPLSLAPKKYGYVLELQFNPSELISPISFAPECGDNRTLGVMLSNIEVFYE